MSSAGEIRGWDQDFGDSFFATIPDIDSQTGATSVPSEFGDCPPNPMSGTEANTLFVASDPIGFIGGMTFIDDILYIVEWDGPTNGPIRLATITPNPGTGCAEAIDVDAAQAIGFSNIENLAYCEDNDTLYAVDFDFGSPHLAQLIRIDPATGVGTAVVPATHLLFDLRVVGLECDDGGTLWGVTSGFGNRLPERASAARPTRSSRA